MVSHYQKKIRPYNMVKYVLPNHDPPPTFLSNPSKNQNKTFPCKYTIVLPEMKIFCCWLDPRRGIYKLICIYMIDSQKKDTWHLSMILHPVNASAQPIFQSCSFLKFCFDDVLIIYIRRFLTAQLQYLTLPFFWFTTKEY